MDRYGRHDSMSSIVRTVTPSHSEAGACKAGDPAAAGFGGARSRSPSSSATGAGGDGGGATTPNTPLIAAGGMLNKSKKRSQRPSWSCTECTRRKIKCDRIVPGCSACRKRGQPELCRLDAELEIGYIASSARNASPVVDQSYHRSVSLEIISSPPSTSSLARSLPPQTQLQPNAHLLPTAARPSSSSSNSVSTSTSLTHPVQSYGPLASSAEYQAITATVEGIRARLHHLEQVLGHFTEQPGQIDDQGHPMYALPSAIRISDASVLGASNGSTRASNSFVEESKLRLPPIAEAPTMLNDHAGTTAAGTPRWESPPEADGELEAAETLEFLAMGRDRKEQHLSRSELRRPDEDEDDDTVVVDPTPSTASAVLGWIQTPAADTPPSSMPRHGHDHGLPPVPGSGGKSPAGKLEPPLLDETRSQLVIRWAMNHMLAHNGLVHPPTFLAECAVFDAWPESDRYRLVNAAWLALYYAVLCSGLQQMTRNDAVTIGLTIDEYHRLPKFYFDTCVEALQRADFLSKHSRFSVQAICVVTTAGYEAGKSDLINTLLGCAIRIAQHLQLHRLGPDSEWEVRQVRKGVAMTSKAGIKSAITREICKRLWCTLGTDDWFTCTYRHTYAIHPSHTTTPLPLNILDADLSVGALSRIRPYDEPTSASKLLVLHVLADRLRELFDQVLTADTPSRDLTRRIEEGIDEVMRNAPRWLQQGWIASEAAPEWVLEMRQHWFISCEHKALVLHRLCPGPALFRNPRHPYVRQCAVGAARRILRQFTTGGMWQRNWTISYHTIVACTTLLLDIFHEVDTTSSSPSDSDYVPKRQEVVSALEALRLVSADSIISSRGVRLVESMLIEEQKLSSIESPRKRPREDDSSSARPGSSGGAGGAGFGVVAKKIVTSARRKSINGGSPLTPNHSNAILPSHAHSGGSTLYDPQLLDAFFSHPTGPNSLGGTPRPGMDEMGLGLGLDYAQADGSEFAALESMLLDGFGREWLEGVHGAMPGVGMGSVGVAAGAELGNGAAWGL